MGRADPQLQAALLAAGVPLADVAMPAALTDALLERCPAARALHPALLRTHVSAAGWRLAGGHDLRVYDLISYTISCNIVYDMGHAAPASFRRSGRQWPSSHGRRATAGGTRSPALNAAGAP